MLGGIYEPQSLWFNPSLHIYGSNCRPFVYYTAYCWVFSLPHQIIKELSYCEYEPRCIPHLKSL